MNRVPLSFPKLAMIAGTRAALGAGVGLLVAGRLSDDQRRAVGWTLVGVGVVTTIPIAVQLLKTKNGSRIGDPGEATPEQFTRTGSVLGGAHPSPAV